MDKQHDVTRSAKEANVVSPLEALFDLFIFLSVMFLVRTVYFESLGFWVNALGKSFCTVGIATLLLYFRNQSWKDIGLTRINCKKMIVFTIAALVATIVSIIIFEVFISDYFVDPSTDVSKSVPKKRFSELENNISYFFSIITFVWIESFLEELQDRGFCMNRFEMFLSKPPLATIIAVIMQAAIFGFRHSYDLSPRSITTGLIGLVFGIIYIVSGRNLWPLILAHIILNTMSMIERI